MFLELEVGHCFAGILLELHATMIAQRGFAAVASFDLPRELTGTHKRDVFFCKRVCKKTQNQNEDLIGIGKLNSVLPVV